MAYIKKKICALTIFIIVFLVMVCMVGCNMNSSLTNSCLTSSTTDTQSCDSNNLLETKKLKSNFSNLSGCEVLSNYIAYESDKTLFDLNDVTLTFYYGGVFSTDIEHERLNGSNIPYAEIYFGDENYKKYFVKKTDGYYVSEKYRCEWILDKNHELVDIKFNHSEPLTVTKEVFIKESGHFFVYLYGENINGKNGMKLIAATTLYYKIENGQIRLSSERFDIGE